MLDSVCWPLLLDHTLRLILLKQVLQVSHLGLPKSSASCPIFGGRPPLARCLLLTIPKGPEGSYHHIAVNHSEAPGAKRDFAHAIGALDRHIWVHIEIGISVNELVKNILRTIEQ